MIHWRWKLNIFTANPIQKSMKSLFMKPMCEMSHRQMIVFAKCITGTPFTISFETL